MILSVVVILLVLGIAYFHLVEGFFTATISAIAAVLAGVLAVAYDEPVVHLLFRGTAGDSINAIVLCMLFIIGYIVIRTGIDKLIPGNVRTPATVDKAGGALMGLVAGTFAMGILVIAAEMLPFGPTLSFLGYSRFPLMERHAVVVPGAGNSRSEDAFVNDQMVDSTLDPEKEKNHLLYPVDDLVMNTVYHLSDGGSLAGAQPLASVHPDWLGELYGQRIGIQTDTRHVALVTPASDPVSVSGVYTAASFPAYDGYGKVDKRQAAGSQIRPEGYRNPFGDQVRAGGGLIPLVVRVKLRSNATDDPDHLFRFSLGSVRLVLRHPDGQGSFGPGKDYYPIGTLEDGKTVIVNRADDFLFANLGNGDGGFDAVFMVDKSAVVGGANHTNVVAPRHVHYCQAAGQHRFVGHEGRRHGAARRHHQGAANRRPHRRAPPQ